MPAARAYFFDVSPLQLAQIAATRLPAGYCDRLRRYRYGPGAFKVDWALSDPIPWRAAECRRAATVHGGAVWIDEQATRGSCFCVRLPVARLPLSATAATLAFAERSGLASR